MKKNLIAILMLSAMLTACATAPTDPEERALFEEANDPLEPMNRQIFAFNQFIDKLLLQPAAAFYRFFIPEPVRDRVGNVLNNLGEPVTFANNVLQGRGSDAADTLARFVMNSTVGLAGMHDVATEMGAPERYADFGQTLHVYGVGEGPYLVLPFFGASNPRDAVGLGIDMALLDPWGYLLNWQVTNDEQDAISAGRIGITIVDRREATLDLTRQLERDSFDYYATMRSVMRQYRAKQLHGGAVDAPNEANFAPNASSN